MQGAVALFFLALAVAHATAPSNYLKLYEGHTDGLRVTLVQPTGIELYDNFLLKISQRTHLTYNDVLARPMYVMHEKDGELTEYFAENGLTSVWRDQNLKPVYDYLLTSGEKVGFAFRPSTYNHTELLKLPITKASKPSNYNVGDLFKVLVATPQLPFFLVTDKTFLDSLKLDPVFFMAKIGLSPIQLPVLVPN